MTDKDSMTAVSESPLRKFPLRFLPASPRARIVWLVVLLGLPLLLSAQTIHYAKPPNVKNGQKIYNGGCITCHGSEGKGAPMASTVFKRPDTFPEFTDCAATTPEPNSAWKAVIIHGGPSRGFSQIMPAFGDLLTDAEINDVIAYMRSLCKNVHHFPLGELNLPKALVTEKAFPENEVLITTAASASGAPSWTTDIIDERTIIDARTQLETDVPVNYADQAHNWTAGFGDITLALKREMFSSLRTGSILSLQGGFLLPTGDSKRGFGAGTAQFEPFAAFDQLFKENTFVQTQLGADLPFDTKVAPRSMYWRVAVGQALAQDHMLGRLFSPMVEFLAVRDFAPGAATNWDILPEMQITISRRQHIRVAFGVREPISNTAGRTPHVQFYLLWDRADGKFWQGWR
ncbi:MAG TPA: c-type cytochrome [Candidatus Dormibacteraeota bacterium]|nr:c-type cytochrome [Candidatus Dormibacteraeota bacterium]